MASILDQVKSVFDAKGVPESVWYPIMLMESGGDPNAVGDNGNSIGLFQLNTAGGQGAGYSADYLKQPVVNAELAAGSIAPAYAAIANQFPLDQQAAETAIRSGHPGGSITNPLSGPAADAAKNKLNQLADQYLAGVNAATPAASATVGASAASTQYGGGIASTPSTSSNPLDALGSALSGVNTLASNVTGFFQNLDWLGLALVGLGALVLVLVIGAIVFDKAAPAAKTVAKAVV